MEQSKKKKGVLSRQDALCIIDAIERRLLGRNQFETEEMIAFGQVFSQETTPGITALDSHLDHHGLPAPGKGETDSPLIVQIPEDILEEITGKLLINAGPLPFITPG